MHTPFGSKELTINPKHIPVSTPGNTGHTGHSAVSSQDDKSDRSGGVDTLERVDTSQKIQTPKMYKVILHNDDFTPMDFVVLILKRFFSKTEEQATQVMLDVHQKGYGVAGVYTLEIAEMKSMQANQLARSHQYPLESTIEAE
jgi:ATP-dependent Clp protease adaptor protein ClpS